MMQMDDIYCDRSLASIEIGKFSHLGARSATLPTGKAFVSQARLIHLLHFFANFVRHKIFG